MNIIETLIYCCILFRFSTLGIMNSAGAFSGRFYMDINLLNYSL